MFNNAQAIVCVFDLTCWKSFIDIQEYLRKVKTFDQIDNRFIIIFGNKSDMVKSRQVDQHYIDELVKEQGNLYLETSVKNNINISEGF